MSILAGILTILLVFLSLFLILIVLMQRGSANGGLGAAMGGGMAESALGAEAANTLSKLTTRVSIGFFLLVFSTYLLQLKVDNDEAVSGAMPEFDTSSSTSGQSAADVFSGLNSSLEEAATDIEAAAEDAEAATDAVAEEAEAAVDAK